MGKTEHEIPKEVEKLSEDISGGYFNYRFIETVRTYGDEIQEKYYEIYEIYYRADGSIWAWTREPSSLVFENFEDVMDTIKHIMECCEKTVLSFKDKNKKEIYDTGKKIDCYHPLLKVK